MAGMKYEINGHVVEADKELSESEIDEIAGQLGGGQDAATPQPSKLDALKSAASKMLPQAEEAADVMMNPSMALLRRAPDMAQRSFNAVQGKPNQPAQTFMEAAGNNPDMVATAGASLIPGAGLLPAAARIAGTAGAAALTPENRDQKAMYAGGLQTVLEAASPIIGKVAPATRTLFAKLSQTEASGLKKIFDNPSLLFTGPSKEEAIAVYNAAASKAGLAPEVSDEVLFGARKRFVKNVTEALQNSEDVPTQALLDARQTVDDLISAARRQGKKNIARGFSQRRDLIDQQLMAQEPGIKDADKVFSQYKTREPFLNVLPRNRYGEISINVPAMLAGLATGGVGAIAASPVVQGVTAASLGMAKKAAPAAKSGLQILRQYIQNQQQNGPASR